MGESVPSCDQIRLMSVLLLQPFVSSQTLGKPAYLYQDLLHRPRFCCLHIRQRKKRKS